MAEKLGMITIGEAPRDDILPFLEPLLSGYAIHHTGVLDGLTEAEVQALAPQGELLAPLITRRKDGTSVTLSPVKVQPLVQQKISEAERDGCTIIWLLCTGVFEGLTSQALFIQPDLLLTACLEQLSAGDYTLGVLVPLASQVSEIKEKYTGIRQVEVTHLSPYDDWSEDELERVSIFFAEKQCDLIVLDCMGFSGRHKDLLSSYVKRKIVVPNLLIASVVKELSIGEGAF